MAGPDTPGSTAAPTPRPGALTSTLALLRATHPEPAAAVTVVATLLAIVTGRDARGVLAVAITVVASQLATGWSNDAIDAARDQATGRRDKPVAAGAVPEHGCRRRRARRHRRRRARPALRAPRGGRGLDRPALRPGVQLAVEVRPVLGPALPGLVAVPAFVVLGLPGAPAPPWWLLLAGAALGGGAHFANVLPDLDDDARTGVRGLPHRLGAGWSVRCAALLLAVASALLVFGPPGQPPLLTLAGGVVAMLLLIAGGVSQLRRPHSRDAVRTVIAAALIDVALLVTAGAAVT